MKEVIVVIPTMQRPHARLCETYLACLPFPVDVYWITAGRSWPEAVNLGLKEAKGRDVILMDDDVFITPETFSNFEQYYETADVFGFKLLFPDGLIQHGGGVYIPTKESIGHRFFQEADAGQADAPVYTCHLTTSLVYIKSHVLETLGGMATDYPGIQFEDVDFCSRALKAGFKLLYIPNKAVHLQTASKKSLPMLSIKMMQNQNEWKKRFLGDPEFKKVLESYPQSWALKNTTVLSHSKS